MKIKIIGMVLLLSILLSGCNYTDGRYVSVVPHEKTDLIQGDQTVQPSNFVQLRATLQDIIRSGVTESVIDISRFDPEEVEDSLDEAIRYVKSNYPIAAYGVKDITYEVGTRAGAPAIAIRIDYRHSDVAIRQILSVSGMNQAKDVIANALENCAAGVVLMIRGYYDMDVAQYVSDYAQEHPESVMEIPEVATAVYPDTGTDRVLELRFTYQNSREKLRKMQDEVAPVFASAELYVSGAGDSQRKYTMLYAILTERFSYEYDIVTSITPSYSLLIHGVGDEKAFAVVYSYMCRRAGLECMVVTGTYNGEPHTWNIVCNDGIFSHVDLLQCYRQGRFEMNSDQNMVGYVWDYSAYPACVIPIQPTTDSTEPEPTDSPTDPT